MLNLLKSLILDKNCNAGDGIALFLTSAFIVYVSKISPLCLANLPCLQNMLLKSTPVYPCDYAPKPNCKKSESIH